MTVLELIGGGRQPLRRHYDRQTGSAAWRRDLEAQQVCRACARSYHLSLVTCLRETGAVAAMQALRLDHRAIVAREVAIGIRPKRPIIHSYD